VLCTSGFVDDVISSHNGADTDAGRWRIIHRDSPGGAGDEVCSRRLACCTCTCTGIDNRFTTTTCGHVVLTVVVFRVGLVAFSNFTKNLCAYLRAVVVFLL